MKLSEKAIRSKLKTRVVGSKILVLDSTDSTNERAWHESIAGAPDGTAIFAEEQTRGRGRFGRVWVAPKGKALLASIILRPNLEAARAPLVTAVGALAAIDACEEAAGVKGKIRFPNDVMVGPRKLAGILVESRFVSNVADLFIIGIGINVNLAAEDFPEDVRPLATSLSIETGKKWDRNLVATALLQSLDHWYDRLDGREIARAFRQRSAILRKRVEITEAGKTFVGQVDDQDVLDGISLRLDNGMMKHVRGEHVELLRLV
jgi:BirA family biotin operon repressor/biotin-[acetyl-CoA-carboxylase] ligase